MVQAAGAFGAKKVARPQGRAGGDNLNGLPEFLSDWDIAFAFFLPVLAALVLSFGDRARKLYEERTVFPNLMPYDRVILIHLLAVVILTTLSVVSLSIFICERVFEKEEVGAFFEAENYETDYEALLSFEKRSIFCIVHVQRETEIYNSNRYSSYSLVNPIQLPYGVERYFDNVPFYEENSSFELSFSGVDGCSITLIRPATAKSYEKLKKEVVALSGEFYASKKSDKYHYPQCPYVERIYEGNLIYFQSKQEARVFGYVMCDYCRMNYSY